MKAEILIGDCLERMRELPPGIAQTCITSPPYFGLRDYGVDGQIGLEPTPEEFVAKLVEAFREVRRVLRDDGTLWLNLGDSYNAYNGNRGASTGIANSGHHEIMPSLPGGSGLTVKGLKPKDLIGIPWRVAFALQADGWYLRSDIIWHKPNPMPESVTDRPTKAHEYLFLLAKSDRYYFDSEAFKEPADPSNYRANPSVRDVAPGQTRQGKLDSKRGDIACDTRNRRTVWTIQTHPFKGAHFATFPPALVEPCVLAGCPIDGTVLDPFNGAGTTGLVALRNQRNYIGCELNPEYAAMAEVRIRDDAPMLNEVSTR
jgi:DNA modification methylase